VPTSGQAKKRVRQTEKRRVRHKAKRTEIKTLQKKIEKDMGEKKDAAALAAEMKALQVKLDKAAKSHSLHANTVARKKSRLQRKLNKLAQAAAKK
jgi:small subunit ribosomal protein S20